MLNYDELDQLFLDAGNSSELAPTDNTGSEQAVESVYACMDSSPSHIGIRPLTNPPANSPSTPINSSQFAPPKTEAWLERQGYPREHSRIQNTIQKFGMSGDSIVNKLQVSKSNL